MMQPARVRFVALCAIGLALGIAQPSRADLAPPPEYQQTCVLARQQQVAQRCEPCDADFREPDRCDRALSGKGLERRCRTRGQSAWTEIWCEATKPRSASAAGASDAGGGSPTASGSPAGSAPRLAAPVHSARADADTSKSGCTLRPGGATPVGRSWGGDEKSHGGWPCLLAVGLWLATRRAGRRARRPSSVQRRSGPGARPA